MRKIRDVLRLFYEKGLSQRAVGRSLALSREAVRDYIVRATSANLSWPLPSDIDDEKLEAILFPVQTKANRNHAQPNWKTVHNDLIKQKGATLKTIHTEYLEAFPDGLRYSTFCEQYRVWAKRLKPYLRLAHKAGEKVMVDYAGRTQKIVDPVTGVIRTAQIFVGVLSASSYIYCEAHWSQSLPDWISAHTRMLEFFGGVPKVIICDNLKSAVKKASYSEPEINQTYQAFAEHYDVLIVPAKPRSPQHKASVENAVQVIERWILFVLRKTVFTSLDQLNNEIKRLLSVVNLKQMQKLEGTRLSRFQEIDMPALNPLPINPYVYTEFRKSRVGQDGRFSIGKCEYSAPSSLCGIEIDLRVTGSTVEILHKNRRVASHVRGDGSAPVIDPNHMTPEHRYYTTWNTDVALSWASSIGPSVREYMEKLLSITKGNREAGMKVLSSMRSIANDYGNDRLGAACAHGNQLSAQAAVKNIPQSISFLRSILRTSMDRRPIEATETKEADFVHENLRGPDYYH